MQKKYNNENSTPPFIDFETTWASLKPALDAEAKRREKRKRRFIFFWFTVAAIAIGTGVFVANKKWSIENGNKELGVKNNKDLETIAQLRNDNKNIVTDSKSVVESAKSVVSNPKNVVSNSKSVVSYPKNVVSNPKNVVSNSKSVVSSPKNVVSYPKNVVSYPKNIVSYPKNVVSYPKNIVSYPKNVVAIADIQQQNKELQTTNNKQQNPNPKPQTINEKPQTPNNKQETKNNKQETTNPKPKTKYEYGLMWNAPVFQGSNFFDINAVKQPTTLLIPSIWVSKHFGKKHSVQLQINPYAQYFLNNKVVLHYNVYTTTVQTSSQLNNKPNENTYTETISYNKLISFEAGLLYNYQLSNKIKIGVGISNNWLQGTLMQNKIVKNYNTTTRDSLYGIDKNDTEWNNIQSSFILGKIEIQYQIKKLQIGINFNKPISNIFNATIKNNTPINTNLFVKWKLK